MNSQREMSHSNSCIVIGSGISGLAAAQYLQKNGFQVQILEANSRIGGRICPMELEANLLPLEERQSYKSITVQCGANWVHDLRPSNPIYRLVTKENLNLYETHDGESLFSLRSMISDRSYYETHSIPRIYTPDEIARVNEIGNKMERHYGIIRKRLRKLKAIHQHQISLAQVIDRAILRISNEERAQGQETFIFQQSIQQLLYLHYAFMDFSEGYELDRVSFTRWNDVADEDFEFGEAIICEGTSRLLSPLSEGLDITLNCTVHTIDWSGLDTSLAALSSDSKPIIHLHTSQGIFSSPHVIVTTSVGVLQSGPLTFSPPLPSNHQKSLSKIQMAHMNVVILRFKKKFWTDDHLLFAATPPRASYMAAHGTSNDDPHHDEDQRPITERNDIFSHFYNLSMMRQSNENGEDCPPLLFGEVYGDTCVNLLSLASFEEIAQAAYNTLQLIFGSQAEYPIGVMTKAWGRDPLTLGSWCNYCIGVSPDDVVQLGQPICSCCTIDKANKLLKKEIHQVKKGAKIEWNCSLQISGEGTSPVQVGTLQGAHDTGVRSAKHILQYHQQNLR